MVADGDAKSPAPARPPSSRLPFQPESLLGTTLDGRYRISAHLASGGMGAVFRAEHVYMRKDVALKVLRPDLTTSPDLAERFRRESEIAASLSHENIVRVMDFGRSPDGYLFLAMELLEGESLYERLRHSGPMAPADAVPILLQVCAGLEAAHRRAVVHRDLKPENIFLDAPRRSAGGGEDPGLRHRQDLRPAGSGDHRRGHGGGHAGVPLAGAGVRAGGGLARRHLRGGHRGLAHARRAPPVPGRQSRAPW